MRHKMRATETTEPVNPRGHLFDEGGQVFPDRIELPRKNASKRTWMLFAKRFLPRLKAWYNPHNFEEKHVRYGEKVRIIESHLS